MGLLDRIFGTSSPQHGTPRRPPPGSDTYALERYRYMLQTAPPETIEQAHAEAFEQLSPEQRRQVLAELARSAPHTERSAIERTTPDDPRALARVATRAEIRQPGFMERMLGASPAAGFGAGLLGSFAAAFAGSMVANAFFSSLGGFDGFGEDAGASDDGELGANDGGASGAADDGGSLAGVGDADADFDGGDFDGGDFDV
jgi:hypothetical protein